MAQNQKCNASGMKREQSKHYNELMEAIRNIANLEEQLHEAVMAGEELVTMVDINIKSAMKAAKPEEQSHYSKVIICQKFWHS